MNIISNLHEKQAMKLAEILRTKSQLRVRDVARLLQTQPRQIEAWQRLQQGVSHG